MLLPFVKGDREGFGNEIPLSPPLLKGESIAGSAEDEARAVYLAEALA